MSKMIRRLIALAAIFFVSTASAQEPDPLPSWNDGASKQAIVDFVTKVTEPESADYVSPADRVTTLGEEAISVRTLLSRELWLSSGLSLVRGDMHN